MDLQRIVALVLQVSIFLMVFGFGLRSSREELSYAVCRPAMLLRALLAMFIVMPVVAILLCVAFDFHPAVEIALVTLAISPMPPLLTNREAQAGGHVSYGIGLMVVAALLSIAFIPVAVSLIGRILGLPIAMGQGALLRLVLLSVILPLGLGILVRTLSVPAAGRAQKPVAIVAITGLMLSVAVVMIAMLPTALSLIGNGTVLVFVGFVIIGFSVGHALGGPSREERAVLALTTACRHPAIAVAVAGANFPRETLVPAAVLLYLLVNVLLSVGYILLLRQTRHAGVRAETG
jgi:bile acid:Na+ symporter, BASS family